MPLAGWRRESNVLLRCHIFDPWEIMMYLHINAGFSRSGTSITVRSNPYKNITKRYICEAVSLGYMFFK